MAAQMDHKAQWLTWVPFDNYWENGKIWRCTQLNGPAAAAAARARRPPLLPPPRWRRDVQVRVRPTPALTPNPSPSPSPSPNPNANPSPTVQAINSDPQAYYASNAVDKVRLGLGLG